MPYVLLLGGARSGKSDLAQRIATRACQPITLIATAEAGDAEMAERIARHRRERPPGWATVEEPVDLLAAIKGAPGGNFLVVDCLTLWVSNLIGSGERPDAIIAAAAEAAKLLAESTAGAVVVSNEVGLGIVPANELARTFRDTLGSANKAFAALADWTALLVAGRVLELMSAAEFMEAKQWPAHSSST